MSQNALHSLPREPQEEVARRDRRLNPQANELADPVAFFQEHCGTTDSMQKNFQLALETFRNARKLSVFLDLLLSPESTAFHNMVTAGRTGLLARNMDRMKEFRERVFAAIEAGGIPRLNYSSNLPQANILSDPELFRVLFRLKYAGIKGAQRPNLLFKTAAELSKRIDVNGALLDFLFANSRVGSMGRTEWQKQVLNAIAILHVWKDTSWSLQERYDLIDPGAIRQEFKQIDPARGALLLVHHSGFQAARRLFLTKNIPNIKFMARRAANANCIGVAEDPRGALFVALKALLQKHVLALAPDGIRGTQNTEITVLGKKTQIGDGAAFLAYESHCDTYWFSMNLDGDRFVPVLLPGPRRSESKSFAEFKTKIFEFYEKMLNDYFSGDPQNLVLAPRWLATFDEDPEIENRLRHASLQRPVRNEPRRRMQAAGAMRPRRRDSNPGN